MLALWAVGLGVLVVIITAPVGLWWWAIGRKVAGDDDLEDHHFAMVLVSVMLWLLAAMIVPMVL